MPLSGESIPGTGLGRSPRSLATTPGVHEWMGDSPARIPPLTVLIDLAWDAIAPAAVDNPGGGPEVSPAQPPRPGRVVWIGRGCWPYPWSGG